LVIVLIGLIACSFGLVGVLSQNQTVAINNLASSLIAPSITMNGLFITFTPVIAFFFLSEIKDLEKESEAEQENIKKSSTKKKMKKP
jgi:hypothetical protein